MQAGKQKVYSEIGEDNRDKADYGKPGNPAAAPAAGETGMQG